MTIIETKGRKKDGMEIHVSGGQKVWVDTEEVIHNHVIHCLVFLVPS
jgi:hypothetical protein